MTKRAPLLVLPLLLAALACGAEEVEGDPIRERLALADRTAAEAAALREAGREAAAHETYLRAIATAGEALAGAEPGTGPGPVRRIEVLNRLANLSVEAGERSPRHLALAVRYATRALAEGDWPLPHVNLGLAYSRAGLGGRALGEIERALAAMPEEERRARTPMLVKALYNRASELLRQPGPEDVAAARNLLERAYELDPDPVGNEAVFRGLAALDERYAAEAAAAAEAGDAVALAAVHARYGFAKEAEEYLLEARNAVGRTEEVRYVEARFVREIPGTPEGLETAARIYEEMIGRGERLPQATAGWARATRRLGRPEAALDRYGDHPEPGAELRAELIRSGLARVRALPPGAEEAERELARIEERFLGGLDPVERRELLVDAAFLAADRGDAERLGARIRELQTRYPNDLAAAILEGRREEIVGAPLPGAAGEEE